MKKWLKIKEIVMPMSVMPTHIPTAHLLKLAVDLGIPVYDDQVKNLYEDYYVKEALSLAPINIPRELLRSEIENPTSQLNQALAVFYTYVQMQEISKLEKIKIKNEIKRIEKIHEDFKQYLLDIKQDKLLKEFWKSLGDNKLEERLLKLLEQQKREEELKYLKKLLAVASAKEKLSKAAADLNNSSKNLAVVLSERVQTAIDTFEGERLSYLAETAKETMSNSNQLEMEQKRLVEMERSLEMAREHPHLSAHEIHQMQERIAQQENTIANHEMRVRIGTVYIDEQTDILNRQQKLRKKMPQVLKSHHVDTADLGPSGVATRAILATVIQSMKALKDKETYTAKVNKLLGISTPDNISENDQEIIKPSELLKLRANEKLKSILAVGADVEKKEVKNIKDLKVQMQDIQKKIDDIENDLNSMVKKRHNLPVNRIGNKKY
jgi:hypothetical protein